VDRIDTLEQRIKQLEQRQRGYHWGGIAVTLITIAALLMGAASPNVGKFDAVLTKSLHVQNYGGREVFTVATNEMGHGFMLISNGDENTVLYAGNKDNGDGGALTLYNRTGKEVVQLAVDDKGNGLVDVYNNKGKGRTTETGPEPE
jgi:hypothetical protein